MKKDIITSPSEILRKVSIQVEKFDSEVKNIITDLFDTLDNSSHPGVGLAAPQIGINKRILVIGYKGDVDESGSVSDKVPRMALINPTISKFSKEKVEMDEGCFSVPLSFGPVTRPKKIKVTATDQNGKKVCINASGYVARVIQHEIDHLDGILFTDLVADKSRIVKYALKDGKYEVEL